LVIEQESFQLKEIEKSIESAQFTFLKMKQFTQIVMQSAQNDFIKFKEAFPENRSLMQN
jgi:hypothetical protein